MKPPVSIWKKYQDATASREELEALDTWLQQANSDELAALFQADTADVAGEEGIPTEMAIRLQARLQEMLPSGRRIYSLRNYAVRWAAASVLIAGISSLLLYLPRHKRAGSEMGQIPAVWDSIANTSAGVKVLTLPDQTRIWLNKQAVLYIRKDYSNSREVRLQGEGYFDVAHDEAHPFRVTTGNVQTLVLGTAFNIDNTPGQRAVYISLVKGSVKVQHQAARQASTDTVAVILQPGEMLTADHQGGHIPVSKIGIADVGAWMKGNLVFNQLPLSEALPKLAAYYGIRIQAAPALLQNKTVTALYRQDETWQQVLHHLLFIYQLSYKIGPDKEIIIHS